jgi:glutamine synthetase
LNGLNPLPEVICRRLLEEFGLAPVVATEIEFYLHGASATSGCDEVIEIIRSECDRHGIVLASAERERGPDQYEVALYHSRDCARVAADTSRFKTLLHEIFLPRGITSDFSAKPLMDAPGSGLHVHVHLEDASGNNIFFRKEDIFSPSLLHAIGGLLALMNPSMPVFAPYHASYARFAAHSNAPVTVSWGTNNRTVAVRLPTKPLDNKHIEHRVAGSDANPQDVLAAILAGIHYGLANACDPGAPTYGDAALPQYMLAPLVRSLEEAIKCMHECAAMEAYSAACV